MLEQTHDSLSTAARRKIIRTLHRLDHAVAAALREANTPTQQHSVAAEIDELLNHSGAPHDHQLLSLREPL